MANQGKKRAHSSGSASSKSKGGAGGASSGKRVKLDNKKSSSKSGGKAAAAAAAAAAKSKAKGKGKGGAGTEPAFRQAPAANASGKPKKDKERKGTIKEFVGFPNGRGAKDPSAAEGSGSGSGSGSDNDDDDDNDEQDEDEESVIGVEDMLVAPLDSDGEDGSAAEASEDDQEAFMKRSAFLTQLDKKELARSRAYLAEQHRLSKPAPLTKADKLANGITSKRAVLPKIGPARVEVNSDGEENLDALSDDDFAKMGSDDGDDSEDWGSDDELDAELSEMDDLDDDDEDASDFSDLDSEADGDEDEEDWSGLEEGSEDDGAREGTRASRAARHAQSSDDDEDMEAKYAELLKKRNRREAEEDKLRDKRLPVKLASGQMAVNERSAQDPAAQHAKLSREEKAANRVRHANGAKDETESEDEETLARRQRKAQPKPNPYGARFGRPSVSSVLEIEDRVERIMAAREELATLGREIVGEPELGMNLLRRLLSFTERKFMLPGMRREEGLPVDIPIRSLAMLSLLAVFLDILPGYRIRAITDAEKQAKTSQIIIQQREYEEGLVNCYRRFLETCEEEVKTSSLLAPVALKCLCELLKEKSYFNFSVNIMEVIVKTLGRREFDSSSELCVATISSILSSDTVGTSSLELVKLIARTIKARSYLVHPAMVSCLLSLRLSDLNGVRASTERVDRAAIIRKQNLRTNKDGHKKSKGPQAPYINKKTRKVIKEKRDIEKELAEAESEVRVEEKSKYSTETLKLLFSLYFRVLKLPVEQNSPLLPPALEGLARFATLVNVDFFKDLLNVLKTVMMSTREMRIQLLCIVTALELLTGQGEAINIDLSAFVTHLYGAIVPLTISPTIEEKPSNHLTRHRSAYSNLQESELLFRCLYKIFLTSRLPNPPVRCLAFSKRLLVSALHWPKNTALRSLDFVRQLLVKERSLDSMLNTEDRKRDGVYRYDIAEEGLSNPDATVWWELSLLETSHFDEEVRNAASNLARWTKDS